MSFPLPRDPMALVWLLFMYPMWASEDPEPGAPTEVCMSICLGRPYYQKHMHFELVGDNTHLSMGLSFIPDTNGPMILIVDG